ncbi:solute carrier family 28 member 3-like [Babylonia areolata]|uniref:solute carrier family 28 member 3-like n=1 Tax=Babylonia areolata TaxID=304850 RepID=UPI003FD6A556
MIRDRLLQINWHAVFWGMSLQFWFAVLIKKTTFGSYAFEWLGDRFIELLHYTDKGSRTVFGATFTDHKFVFQIMPTLIFFNALISMFYYLGVVQIFIAKFGKFLSFCLGTSPIECVNAAANLFLTLSEAPILIKPFMADITQSELFAVMTGGFASIAGSLLYAFSSYGAPINHILTASVMSAPAALAFAKLIYPDERKPTIKAEDAYKVDVRHYGSMLGALSKGAKDGLTMAGYVVINLLIYVALLEFLDQTLQWFMERAGVHGFTFSKLIAYVFYPLTYVMGFEVEDCLRAARLLGIKIFTTTVVVFVELGKIITNGKVLQEYIDTYNGTWTSVGDDIFLEATNTTLVGGVLSERSGILATYMVCGLSNLGAIGVAIGAYTSLAPSRSVDVYRMVVLALFAGNIASFSTACMAGEEE